MLGSQQKQQSASITYFFGRPSLVRIAPANKVILRVYLMIMGRTKGWTRLTSRQSRVQVKVPQHLAGLTRWSFAISKLTSYTCKNYYIIPRWVRGNGTGPHSCMHGGRSWLRYTFEDPLPICSSVRVYRLFFCLT